LEHAEGMVITTRNPGPASHPFRNARPPYRPIGVGA
jgi:hypothetical protein